MKSQMLFLVALAFSHALAVPVTTKSATPSGKKMSLINPPLKDVSSDKKFFGPPFPADYPDDKRPAVDKSILNKLKGPDQPYPALQGKAEYDADYVKDENSDKGAWKAQMEYDRLRRELQKAKDAERDAQARADKEGSDVDGAKKNADDADKGLSDAEKNAKNAAGEGDKDGDGSGKDASGTGSEDGTLVPPSEAELEKLKEKVKAAEENLAKEEKEFAECKRQLEEAKKNLAELKAKHDEMEKQLASQTKLWEETKTVRLNVKKAKEEAAHARVEAAQAKLKEAQEVKEEMDRALATQKAESEKAQASLAKERADVAKMKKDLEAATLRLQKLRGIAPPPAKSSAHVKSALSMLVFVVLQALL